MTEKWRRPWWRISFRLSRRSILSIPALVLLSIGFFLWLPAPFFLLLMGFFWFNTAAYFLGVLIEQFNFRRKSILVLAFLMLALSLLSYISVWYFFPDAGNGRLVMMIITSAFWLPLYLREAYSLLEAYKAAP
ncbi:MAG: hypothetical protein QXO47_01040 [Thermoproteota archaeon]